MYKSVLDQKCLFPKKAKEAQKQLKALGVTDCRSKHSANADLRSRPSAAIESVMRRGLLAENRGQYTLATKLYAQAHRMDPRIRLPLRYLGENYRHNIGDLGESSRRINQILDMPADPLSRSVASTASAR
jgi:tetratricopeptide (TPR) repeat protein